MTPGAGDGASPPGPAGAPAEDGGADASGAPFRVLFVCTGNTCRSPMAAALARASIEARGWAQIEVHSAGIAAPEGAPASEGAKRAAERHGLSLDGHAATRLSAALVEDADLILTMGASHLAAVHALGGRDRAAQLTTFARTGGAEADPTGPGVVDPFGGDDAVYEATWHELVSLVEAALGRLGPLVEP